MLQSAGTAYAPVQDRHAAAVNARTVDFFPHGAAAGRRGDRAVFSFSTTHPVENKAVCYLTYTNERTHAIIRAEPRPQPDLLRRDRGRRPRYCPSIETKIMTFPDKPRHQLFIEPMGLDTEELYIQGFSLLPAGGPAVAMLHTLAGARARGVTRCAYAIEYDCVDPTELLPTLEGQRCPASTARGSSTARPAMRRRPCRASSRA